MNLVVQSLDEWPNSLELMYLKSQLELNLSGPEVTIKNCLLCFFNLLVFFGAGCKNHGQQDADDVEKNARGALRL